MPASAPAARNGSSARVPVVGILALQGDFEAHAKMVRSLGAEPREVRVPADLEGLDALIIPGASRPS